VRSTSGWANRPSCSSPDRRVAIGALLLLLLGSCAAPTQDARTGDPSLLPSDQRPPSAASSSPTAGANDGSGGGTIPGPTAPPGSTVPITRTGAIYADDGGVGQMARAYLRASPARRLIVEVDWIQNREPSQTALDHVETILERETGKPDGVAVQRGNEIRLTRNTYTFDQIEQLEDANRSRRSAGSVATLYVLYLNGELADEEGTIGVAYRASGIVLFADLINSAATSLIHPSAIERSVLIHETGHILGLVNIGYRSRHDHEDPDHPHHSKYRSSVMYWQVEDTSVASILAGGPPSDFDRYDRDDLALLRQG